MDLKYKNQLISTFNQLSKTYKNKFSTDEIEKEKILSLINTWEIKSYTSILEVGSGNGDLTKILNKLFPNIYFYCLDISENMINIAKKKLKNYANINFINSEIESFNPEIKFDQIIIFNTFPHFQNKLHVFKHCYNLLKKKGKLIICHNESRLSILSHHKYKAIKNKISNFPNDILVKTDLEKADFKINTFENNEGYDYYLVIAQKL